MMQADDPAGLVVAVIARPMPRSTATVTPPAGSL
jgi:hypothetical protein